MEAAAKAGETGAPQGFSSSFHRTLEGFRVFPDCSGGRLSSSSNASGNFSSSSTGEENSRKRDG